MSSQTPDSGPAPVPADPSAADAEGQLQLDGDAGDDLGGGQGDDEDAPWADGAASLLGEGLPTPQELASEARDHGADGGAQDGGRVDDGGGEPDDERSALADAPPADQVPPSPS